MMRSVFQSCLERKFVFTANERLFSTEITFKTVIYVAAASAAAQPMRSNCALDAYSLRRVGYESGLLDLFSFI